MFEWCSICKRFWYLSEFDDYGKDVRIIYQDNLASFSSVIEKNCSECSEHAWLES